MRTIAFFIMGLFLLTAFTLKEARTTKESSFRDIQPQAFQPGERLRYRLHYGIVDAGEAILEVKKSEKTVKGREVWHVKGTGRTLGAFNMFYKVRDVYESYIDAKGVFPWVFVRRVDEGGYKINQDYTFYQHKNKVNNGDGKEFSVPSHVQDMISSFYYARTLDFQNAKVGDIFTINVFLDDEIYPMKIKYTGKETLRLRKGKFNCMKFNPVVQEGRVFNSDEDLEVWITDDQNKIPVLAKAKIKVGSIKMQLVEWDGLSHPLNMD